MRATTATPSEPTPALPMPVPLSRASRSTRSACRWTGAASSSTPARTTRRTIPQRARLAYRDVASATNRLTLIAAIVPARAVTTHTLFCLKTRLPLAEQHVLCALLNSFVANYLIRLRVNTHVTVALVSRLPVPVVRVGHPFFDRLSALVRGARSLHVTGRGHGGVRTAAGHLRAPLRAEARGVRACAGEVSVDTR